MSAKEKETEISIGKIMGVERIEDLPKAILDTLLEGLSANPQDFAILGMGFLVGYEGLDVTAFMMRSLKDMVDNFGQILIKGITGTISKTVEDLVYPMSQIPVQMGGIIQDISKLIGGPVWFPDKHITPATRMPSSLGPGVSYYGPPPAGIAAADWPPYGISLAKLQDSIASAAEADKAKLMLEGIIAEQKIKILMGCIGAITAYALTRPGVAQSLVGALGNVVSGALQGAGSAVPF
jgi:hypothetical protein